MDCRDNVGFFNNMMENEIYYYARNFHSKYGFWRPGTGCILPHSKRSITCLTHHCLHGDLDMKGISPEEVKEVTKTKYGIICIKNKLHDLSDKIYSVTNETNLK
jgi:hypothetical protein